MIIGNYLCELFEGLTIDVNGKTIAVKSTFDDQFALEKFIKEFDARSLEKFPLVFCMTAKTTGEKTLRSKRQIVIMTNTNPDWLSKDRNANTFVKVIHPIYQKIIPIIESSPKISIIGDRKTRIEFTDKTNYGILKGSISKKNTDSESIVTDYIDARIIELELEYHCCCSENLIH